jgi:hypothetical protein
MEIKKPTVKGRQEAWEIFNQAERELLLNKGHDYTAGQADVDAYANFRIIAELLKGCPITPYTIAMVYAMKHVLSLITFAKSGKQESGEALEGRFHDIRNYMFILNELVPDHVNHLEDAPLASVDRVPVWGGTLPRSELLFCRKGTSGEIKLHNDGSVSFFPDDDLADFPTELKPDKEAQFLGDDGRWHPISDLDRKEVSNSTMPEPQPGELDSLTNDDPESYLRKSWPISETRDDGSNYGACP